MWLKVKDKLELVVCENMCCKILLSTLCEGFLEHGTLDCMLITPAMLLR